MKKVTIVLFVLLIGAGVAVPKFVGDVAHEAYQLQMNNYPTGNGQVQLTVKSYEQSWFSAQAVTMMTIPIGMPEMETMTINITSNIQHGPILFTDTGMDIGAAFIQSNIHFIGLPEKAQAFVDQHLAQDAILISNFIDFNQHAIENIRMKSFSYEDEKINATFGGLIGSGSYNLDYSDIKGELQLPASQIITPDVAINIADATASYDLYKYQEVGMLGSYDVTFPLLEIVAKQSSINLEGISIKVKSSDEQGKLYLKQRFAIQKITAPIPLNAIAYDLEINHLNFKTIKLLTELSAKLQNKADPTQTQAQLRELLDLLLQDGLQINQLLKIEGMGGTLQLDWDSHLVALPDGQHIMDVMDNAAVLQALMMDLRLEVDAAVVMATPFSAMLTPYIELGLIAEVDDKLVADVKLHQGVLTVNEHVLPIETLLPMLGLKPAVASNQESQPEAHAQPTESAQ